LLDSIDLVVVKRNVYCPRTKQTTSSVSSSIQPASLLRDSLARLRLASIFYNPSFLSTRLPPNACDGLSSHLYGANRARTLATPQAASTGTTCWRSPLLLCTCLLSCILVLAACNSQLEKLWCASGVRGALRSHVGSHKHVNLFTWMATWRLGSSSIFSVMLTQDLQHEQCGAKERHENNE
jgi:hypothetical protein